MSASSEALAAPAPAAKSGAAKSKLAIIALVLAIAALAFVFLKPGASAEPAAPPEPQPGPVVDVGQMLVNLADAGRYARVSFALVLAEGTAVGSADGVEANFPLVKEALLFEFSKVTAAQIREPGGLDAIAAALSERARAIYPDGEVMRVVLTELLVQ
ncbi:MAG TPA: flagellar basal body-associated FliL family protein [Egibacteraceae bacterium]|nr:flagellar basal body-associated FliL family protein [Egibacteraceae bacterium]